MNTTCYIHGLGSYAPPQILTNQDLEALVDTSDEWIVTRTGIKQRHILADDEHCSDAASKAAQAALADAGLEPDQLTHILAATCTPDYLTPSLACQVAGNLGLSASAQKQPLMCLDFNAACSGFVYGLELARALCLLHPKAKVLLLGSEALSRKINYQDRSTCVLFGDGAGALVLSADPHQALWRVADVSCHSDGSLGKLITIGGGSRSKFKLGDPIPEDYFIRMNGREVYRQAVRAMTEVSRAMLEQNSLSIADLDLFIAHQANLRIIEGVAKRLDVPEQKVFVDAHNFGNTSAATLPIAMADARQQGLLQAGQRVLLATFGGGLTWGAALLDQVPQD